MNWNPETINKNSAKNSGYEYSWNLLDVKANGVKIIDPAMINN
jgi:hypothetical protein